MELNQYSYYKMELVNIEGTVSYYIIEPINVEKKKVDLLKIICSRFIIKEKINFNNSTKIPQDCIDIVLDCAINDYKSWEIRFNERNLINFLYNNKFFEQLEIKVKKDPTLKNTPIDKNFQFILKKYFNYKIEGQEKKYYFSHLSLPKF